MACGTGFCNSGCPNGEEEISMEEKTMHFDKDERANIDTCIKCKVNLVLNSLTAGEESPFCYACFRSNLFSKFKFAIASSRMVSPSDNILLAFSGGQSSRVALQFLHEMQYKSWKNFESSRDRSPDVFGVGVVFIDESSVNSSCSDITKIVEDMKTVVSSMAPPEKIFHSVPIESLYSSSSESKDGIDKLKEMLDCITDVTGKEDMLLQLRSLCLQKVAVENGYNKIILSSCTSRIACHVISETVKGRGYSLPADIQYIDARWKVPVMLPLRDCFTRELDMLCRLDGLEKKSKIRSLHGFYFNYHVFFFLYDWGWLFWQGRLNTIEVNKGNSPGINGLVSSFVSLLQEDNSSRASTVVRTAGKLNRFSFNEIPKKKADEARVVSGRVFKNSGRDINGATFAEDFCRVCNSPTDHNSRISPIFSEDGILGWTGAFVCCRSCRFQMLPTDPSSLHHFFHLLPVDSSCSDMRGEIEHLLLSCEDEIDGQS